MLLKLAENVQPSVASQNANVDIHVKIDVMLQLDAMSRSLVMKSSTLVVHVGNSSKRRGVDALRSELDQPIDSSSATRLVKLLRGMQNWLKLLDWMLGKRRRLLRTQQVY